MTRFDLFPPLPEMPPTPTWETLEEWSLHEPTLRSLVALVQRGDLTREEALLRGCLGYARTLRDMMRREVERLQTEVPRIIVQSEAPQEGPTR